MISLEAKSVSDFVWLVREFFGVENPCRFCSIGPTQRVHECIGSVLRNMVVYSATADFRVVYDGAVEVTPQLLSDLAAAGVIFASTRAELQACGVVCHKDQR